MKRSFPVVDADGHVIERDCELRISAGAVSRNRGEARASEQGASGP